MGHTARFKSLCLYSSAAPTGKYGADKTAMPPVGSVVRRRRSDDLPPHPQYYNFPVQRNWGLKVLQLALSSAACSQFCGSYIVPQPFMPTHLTSCQLALCQQLCCSHTFLGKFCKHCKLLPYFAEDVCGLM